MIPAVPSTPAAPDRPVGPGGRVVPAATRWLRRGLDVLFVGLLALALAGALASGTVRGLVAVAAGAALLALYVLGRRRLPLPDDVGAPRGAWWPAGAWVTGLVVLWVALCLTSVTAVWVAFPLMFVAMHVLGPRRGPVAVGAVVLLVVGVMWAYTAHLAVPFVLGPAIGGAVAVVVVLALEAVVRESQERQRTLDELSGRATSSPRRSASAPSQGSANASRARSTTRSPRGSLRPSCSCARRRPRSTPGTSAPRAGTSSRRGRSRGTTSPRRGASCVRSRPPTSRRRTSSTRCAGPRRGPRPGPRPGPRLVRRPTRSGARPVPGRTSSCR